MILLIIVGAIFAGLFFTLGASIGRFTERVGFYTSQLNGQLDSLDALIERLGLSNVDLRDVVKPGALADALGVVLSGIAGFLSDLFLITARSINSHMDMARLLAHLHRRHRRRIRLQGRTDHLRTVRSG